jgi:hypothetical protein
LPRLGLVVTVAAGAAGAAVLGVLLPVDLCWTCHDAQCCAPGGLMGKAAADILVASKNSPRSRVCKRGAQLRLRALWKEGCWCHAVSPRPVRNSSSSTLDFSSGPPVRPILSLSYRNYLYSVIIIRPCRSNAQLTSAYRICPNVCLYFFISFFFFCRVTTSHACHVVKSKTDQVNECVLISLKTCQPNGGYLPRYLSV